MNNIFSIAVNAIDTSNTLRDFQQHEANNLLNGDSLFMKKLKAEKERDENRAQRNTQADREEAKKTEITKRLDFVPELPQESKPQTDINRFKRAYAQYANDNLTVTSPGCANSSFHIFSKVLSEVK